MCGNLYDQHAIKIISMDKDGNTTFAVYGYMNRGEHEGEVGAAIYYLICLKMLWKRKRLFQVINLLQLQKRSLGNWYITTMNRTCCMC